MGVLIGHEIIQTRDWMNPHAPPIPDYNYKNVFPISVFEAIRADYRESSTKLSDVIDDLYSQLKHKQPIFDNRPANYLMTYAGVSGGAGAIEIAYNINWDPSSWKHDKIPTEKAVGEFFSKLGLIDETGQIVDPETRKVRWSDILNRPNWYSELGNNEDGFLTQNATTKAINNIIQRLDGDGFDFNQRLDLVKDKIDIHLYDQNNPHYITPEIIGAVTQDAFDFHVNNSNPHNTTKADVGLGRVDNTSDSEKPISNATQIALDITNGKLNTLTKDVNDLNFFMDARYDLLSGNIILTYSNGKTKLVPVPISGLVKSGYYKNETKEFVFVKYGGEEVSISLKDLFANYTGSTGPISIEIEGDPVTGDQKIKAIINDFAFVPNNFGDNSIIERAIANGAVTTSKIKDLSITNSKYANESITFDKLAPLAVTANRIDKRAVTGEKIFSSITPNRVLAVTMTGSDPAWLQVVGSMIANETIKGTNIARSTITNLQLAEGSVDNNNLVNRSITSEKYDQLSILNDHIANGTITGSKIADSIYLPGTPKISQRPASDSANNDIPDTLWVSDKISKITIQNEMLSDRIIEGRNIFTSTTSNRVLVVKDAETDPIWSRINRNMLEINSIGSDNIIDLNVTKEKIADKAITSRHIFDKAILNGHIADDAIDSSKIWRSDKKDMVLAAITAKSNPVYTKINREMLSSWIIGTNQIEDLSVTMKKLESSNTSYRLLGVGLHNTTPMWLRANNEMLDSRSVDGRVLFTSSDPYRVLGVDPINGSDPSWVKIVGKMLQDKIINGNHIIEKSIKGEHISDRAIQGSNIDIKTITRNNISPRAIGGGELFTSYYANRVLGIGEDPNVDPSWIQITRDMLEDEIISGDKFFRASRPYEVLLSTNPGKPPEFGKITGDFLTDGSITWAKLCRDFIFFGTPEITKRPAEDADNQQIPDTRWVRQTVAKMVHEFNLLWEIVTGDMIAPRSISKRHLFSNDIVPRVLGITSPGADPEYILIEKDLIVNGAVTKEKLDRDLVLWGSPKVEVRPSPTSSTSLGGGSLIPDCQWVLDRINDAGVGTGIFDPSGTGTPVLTDNSIITSYIQNRAITGEKFFTSAQTNRLLGVLTANGTPEYTQVNNEMLLDRIIDGRTLFTSPIDNKILGVEGADSNPKWMNINWGMMGPNSVGAEQMRPYAIKTENIQDSAVTYAKLADVALIDENRLFDQSITNRKLGMYSVTADKISDDCIDGSKLKKDLIFDGNPTVKANTNYETRSLRNSFISPNLPLPTDGENGDIWFRYV